jgi:hypothetical protein
MQSEKNVGQKEEGEREAPCALQGGDWRTATQHLPSLRGVWHCI